MESINMKQSLQGCYKAMHIGFCDNQYTPWQKFVDFFSVSCKLHSNDKIWNSLN